MIRLVVATLILAGPAWAQTLPVRAQLSPRQFTTISSELPGKIDRITVRDGDAFKRGDILVEMDCVLQRAQLEKARASLGAAEKTLAVNQRLAEMKSVGALEAQLSAAEVAKARADVSFMSATVSKCTVIAPFSGRVVERKAQSHQYITAGQPLLDILDDRSLDVEFLVPSSWVSWMAPGTGFTLAVDETARTYPAKVGRLGARVDPVSQSIKVIGEVTGGADDLRPGMSGVVTVTPPMARP
jgi:membrane fusion protein (multidrug efflux system)